MQDNVLSLGVQIDRAWENLKREAAEFVRAYKASGKNGQKVFDQVLRRSFGEIDSQLRDFRRKKIDSEELLAEIDRVSAFMARYQWPGSFCLSCGEPIVQKDVLYCYKCRPAATKKAERDRHDYSLPSATAVKTKKGSALRHGHGHAVNSAVRPRDRKKGKGGKTAK